MANKGKDLLQLQDELFAMPEWARLQEIRQFTFSLQIFQGNARELLGILEKARRPEVAVTLWAVKNRPRLEAFQQEVARLLHNFASAAMSLVDHARRFFEKHYKASKSFEDYEVEVKKRFVDDPVCQFVQGLRNYSIHKKVPSIGSTLSLTNDGKPPAHTVFLKKTQLLDFDWKAGARTYLEGLPEQIDLHVVASEYVKRVTAFYDWVYERLNEIHADDLAAVHAKQGEAKKLMGTMVARELEADLRIADQIRTQPEQFFLSWLDPRRWNDICAAETDPASRANALMNAVEEFSPPLGDLRARVVAAFERFYAPPASGA